MKSIPTTCFAVLTALALLASACASPATPVPALEEAVQPSVIAIQTATASLPEQKPTPQPRPERKPTRDQAQPAPQDAQQEGALSVVSGEYGFAEGPAADAQGNVYFSDISAGRIYRWSPDGQVVVFVEGLDGPDGLAFTRDGLLIACEGGAGRLISIDAQGQVTSLVDAYNQVRFNKPNGLWIDAQGGIYFTDPAYQLPVVQDGEHVYYLSPDRSQITRVIDDLVRPNGIVGSADGETLYVADHGAGQTFKYHIQPDGTLTDRQLFVALGSDGMELDAGGSLYLTTPNRVQVYDAAGKHLRDVPTQENPTNLTFSSQKAGVLVSSQ